MEITMYKHHGKRVNGKWCTEMDLNGFLTAEVSGPYALGCAGVKVYFRPSDSASDCKYSISIPREYFAEVRELMAEVERAPDYQDAQDAERRAKFGDSPEETHARLSGEERE